MSTSKVKHRVGNQLCIFDLIVAGSKSDPKPEPGRFNILSRLRQALRDAIKQSPLSVYQIAGEMSHLVGQTITAEIIYTWTRESDELNGRPTRHIPAELLPAFCKVTGSNEPLRIMGEAAGMYMFPGPDALRAEIQRLREEERRVRAEKRKREILLQQIDGEKP